jgi:hypothetical protein
LRERNRRISAQAGSHRWPNIVTSGFGGSAEMPCIPPRRSRASALTFSEISGAAAAIAKYCRASTRITRDGSDARYPP